MGLALRQRAIVRVSQLAIPPKARRSSYLWAGWREIDKNLDAYAALRSTGTAVVVFEPRP